MSKRNAHAVGARQRKAGPHEDRAPITCTECGKSLGFGAPSPMCWPCERALINEESGPLSE